MKFKISPLFVYALIFTGFFCVSLMGHNIKQVHFSSDGSKIIFENPIRSPQILAYAKKIEDLKKAMS